jgi:hypothetical protein
LDYALNYIPSPLPSTFLPVHYSLFSNNSALYWLNY